MQAAVPSSLVAADDVTGRQWVAAPIGWTWALFVKHWLRKASGLVIPAALGWQLNIVESLPVSQGLHSALNGSSLVVRLVSLLS